MPEKSKKQEKILENMLRDEISVFDDFSNFGKFLLNFVLGKNISPQHLNFFNNFLQIKF